MPRMDGYEVARRLRQQKDCPGLLIAISGHVLEQDKVRAGEAGFHVHLAKPTDLKELRRLLAKAQDTFAVGRAA